MAATTDAEAKRLFTTPQQRFLALIRNQPVEVKAPVASMDGLWNAAEREAVDARLAAAIVGGPATVRDGLQQLVDELALDEVFVVTDTYATEDRLRTYDMVAAAAQHVERRETAALAA